MVASLACPAWTARLRRGAGAVLAAGITLAADPAFAEDPACLQSYEQTQTLRRVAKFREARVEAARCARDTCPAVLAKECTKWMGELDQSIPTIVFDVRSASGEELTNVKVTQDGKPFLDKLDGKAVTVDLGPHVFRFEPTDGKSQPLEQKTVIHEGEKNRRVSVTLPAKASEKKGDAERPIPAMAYVFGGVAVASLGAGAVFALRGSSDQSELDACKPSCSAEAVNSVSTSYAIADILLTAGVVSAVAAAYVFLARPTKGEPNNAVGLVHRRLGLGVRF